MSRNILIIDDNQDLAQLLALHLKDLGFEVDLAFDGRQGWSQAQARSHDLIILDLMLPGLDGLEICRRIRGQSNYTPILMLTSKSTEVDRVVGLEIGADDYVTKPFSIRELLARVKAILRRVDELQGTSRPEPPAVLQAGPLTIDTGKHTVQLGPRQIELTAKEFDLLRYFAQHPGQVFTRPQLLDAVWGYGHDGYEHTVNSHINRLRAKIEEDPAHPSFVLTVWGVGYKFTDEYQ